MMRNLISKVNELIIDMNDNLPFIGVPLSIGWDILHRFKFIVEKKILELRGQLKFNINQLDHERIYYVSPHKIQYYLTNKLKKKEVHSGILKGRWDKSKKPIEDLTVYQAFKQKFNEGKKWESITNFKNVLDDISNGITQWGCRNLDELNEKIRISEEIYTKIKNKGNKLEADIFSSMGLNDIIINISRDGNLLLNDGKFSLSLAKVLDLPKVPVKIKIRHKNWMKFREKLKYLGRPDKLYQKITHIDLQDFSFKYGDERLILIKKNLSISSGTLLDIGTNLGYFCHKFEDKGFDCYAVEGNIYYVYFLKKLRKAENKKFKIVNKSIFKYNKGKELVFDVVLALFIFHHFLKKQNSYLNLIKLLNRLKVKEMIFGAHIPRELQRIKRYINYTPNQFVNFILENSCLNKAELLGKMDSGRCIYKLSS